MIPINQPQEGQTMTAVASPVAAPKRPGRPKAAAPAAAPKPAAKPAKAPKVLAAPAAPKSKAPVALDKPAPKVKAAKPAPAAKPAKAPRIEQNGVARPKAGGVCDQAWSIFDAETKRLKRPVQLAEAREATAHEGINPATTDTQYALWRKFNGIAGRKAAA